MASRGFWIVVAAPSIVGFIFGLWVFYNMVIDVWERDIEGLSGVIGKCKEGCQPAVHSMPNG